MKPFWRLKHEFREEFKVRELATRKKTEGSLLDSKQKVYVRRWVKLHTAPMIARGI